MTIALMILNSLCVFNLVTVVYYLYAHMDLSASVALCTNMFHSIIDLEDPYDAVGPLYRRTTRSHIKKLCQVIQTWKAT